MTYYVCDLITLNGEPEETVLAQYNPAERWNGFLCPWIDALSVVTVLDYLNAQQPDDKIVGRFSDDGTLTLVDDHYPDEPDTLTPDADGLYSLGAYSWVWSEVPWPRRTPDGRTIWACCVSSIGPACQHVTAREDH